MTTSATDIERVAGEIKLLNEQYTDSYKLVFDSFRSIDSAWDGEDNQEFNERVMSFEKDFINMTAFFYRVENHLRLSAKAYLTTEAATSKAANKLAK